MTDTTSRYVRDNYRRTGAHFDYGNVQGILNFTATFSTDASGLYYTQLANLASAWLQATASGEILSGMVWVNLYLGSLRTSVWGSADTDDSILAIAHGWLSFSADNPSLYIVYQARFASATLTLIYSGANNYVAETFVFVVSR